MIKKFGNKMKVIILAAGEGRRLRPLTNKNPKCLIKLFGKSLLDWQIELYKKTKISDITVVKGYLENKINTPGINYFVNKNFETSNMVETLFCAKEKISEDIIISYGDIIFEKKVLKKLLKSNDDISLIIDENWQEYWGTRFDNPLDDVESLVMDNNGYILNIGQKEKNLEKIQGQYIGLMRFKNKGIDILKKIYDESKKESKKGKNPLNPKLPFEKSFMTDLLQKIIDEGYKIRAIPIRNGWLELDSYDDYKKYQSMIENKTIMRFFNFQNL